MTLCTIYSQKFVPAVICTTEISGMMATGRHQCYILIHIMYAMSQWFPMKIESVFPDKRALFFIPLALAKGKFSIYYIHPYPLPTYEYECICCQS